MTTGSIDSKKVVYDTGISMPKRSTNDKNSAMTIRNMSIIRNTGCLSLTDFIVSKALPAACEVASTFHTMIC